MSRRARLTASVLSTLVVVAVTAGCASTDRSASDRATTIFDTKATAPAPTTTSTTIPDPECDKANPARSLRPTPGTLPTPGQMPPGSTMAAIQTNGTLKVGV